MTQPRHVHVGNVTLGNDRPLALIAGPCALESRAHAMEMSHALVELTGRLGIGLIYKTSFDKANRTSADSPRGLGMEKALPILAEVRERWGCPVLTDVHSAEQCAPVAEAVDVLQIPAFLCRQTDLIVAAARTGRPVNIKKGSSWPLGHGQRRREDGPGRQPQHAGLRARRQLRLQHAGVGHALAADHGRDGLPRRLRRHPFRAAAGRPGQDQRRATAVRGRPGAPRSPSASPRSSWKPTRTPTGRRAMAPTWSTSPTCQPSSRR